MWVCGQELPRRGRLRFVEQTSPTTVESGYLCLPFLCSFSCHLYHYFSLSFAFLPVPSLHATGICEYLWIFDKPPALSFSVPLLLHSEIG